jgi:hypothetical protein
MEDAIGSGRRKEDWDINGETYRFKQIYKIILNNKPVAFLLSLKKRKPKIMILGAGIGNDLIEFKKELNKHNISPVFDVFSLTKALSDEVTNKKIARHDYSTNLGFEQIDPRVPSHKKIVDKTKGKYDLVMAPLSVGTYTKYPSTILLNSAMLLSKGGRAYVFMGLNHLVVIGENRIDGNIFELNKKYVLLFNKFVSSINKKENTDYKFKLSMANSVTVLIERLN